MAMAAKSFGRRPREESSGPKPAASLGAVLELLRALDWFIRADVPWPTKRGQAFDFVLAGESGVFALWVHDGDPRGATEAAVELGRLLGDVQVRPVVCRGTSSLAQANAEILFCTPETALDLLVGLPAYADRTAIAAIVNRLRELVVPTPPEPEPEPESEPVALPIAIKPTTVEQSAPKPAPVVRQTPPTPMARPEPAAEPSVVTAEPSVVTAEPSLPTHEESVAASEPSDIPKAERVSRGRHRSEKPKRILAAGRRTPPPPPAISPEEPGPPLELPTALASKPARSKGGNEAAQRFDNNYVYLAPSAERPSALKRDFRAKPFVFGIVGLLALVLVVGVGIKEWPKVAGLASSRSDPSASFGQSIVVGTTTFHPNLTLTVTQPAPTAVHRGTVSYAVTLTVSNTGPTAWRLPEKSAFTMVDSLGESAPLAAISGARWSGTLKVHGRWVGKLIFKIRPGRTPASVQVALAATGGETATWR